MAAILLLHGAWHGAWCWERIAPRLAQDGHAVAAPDLPGHGADPTPPGSVTLDAYVDAAEKALDALGAPAFVVAHSMGGIVASSLAERRPDCLRGLVHVSAFLLTSGQSVNTIQTGVGADSAIRKFFAPKPADGVALFDAAGARDAFYGECSDADADSATARLTPQPLQPLVTPLALTGTRSGAVARDYVRCLRDHGVTPAAQQAMLEATPCRRVFTLDTDHSPFYSRADELLAILREILA